MLLSGVRSSWRHVREELGLVLGGERELLRFLLQLLPRQFDLPVLALHLAVLLGEQLRLLLQLLVGLLQLLLLLLAAAPPRPAATAPAAPGARLVSCSSCCWFCSSCVSDCDCLSSSSVAYSRRGC